MPQFAAGGRVSGPPRSSTFEGLCGGYAIDSFVVSETAKEPAMDHHAAFGIIETSAIRAVGLAAGADVSARVKVLDPMTSIGPSMRAVLLSSSESELRLRVPRWIIPGSTVQVLARGSVVFGKAWFTIQSGDGFEVEVELQPAA